MLLTKTYKSRFYCLIYGTLVFIFLCYHLAFKKTLYEYRNLVKNKNQLELIDGAPEKLHLIEERLKATEQELSSITETNKNYQIYILSKSTTIIGSKNLKIIDFPDLSSEISDGFTILTQQVTLQGSFIDLLNFLFVISKDPTIGYLSSVDFFNQKDLRTGVVTLRMRIYFQSTKQKE